MKTRPILFSAPMVRALLEGRKTQTRRIVKPQPQHIAWFAHQEGWIARMRDEEPQNEMVKCPYGQPGDRLWVRETWSQGACTFYRATDTLITKWRPSIFMPRWASRITLEIVSVRVERLNEISSTDCFDEGIFSVRNADFDCKHFPKFKTDFDHAVEFGLKPPLGPSPQGVYKALWESINGPKSWALNPWVWAVEFKRVEESK